MTLCDHSTKDLVSLRRHPLVNRVRGLAATCEALDIETVARCYARQVVTAPNRPRDCRDPRYFVGHNGTTSSSEPSNRREEHLAVALCGKSRLGAGFMLDKSALDFLDYQVPMQATRYDQGIGKIDLFGILGSTTPVVTEMKAESGKDTPLYALIEGLAYCAIVEANMCAISSEVYAKYRYKLEAIKPSLVLLAPEDYWRRFVFYAATAAGEWRIPFCSRVIEIERLLGIKVHCATLKGAIELRMGLNGEPPTLAGVSAIAVVDLWTVDQPEEVGLRP